MPSKDLKPPLVLPRSKEPVSKQLDGGSSFSFEPKPPVTSGKQPHFEFSEIPVHSPVGSMAAGSGGHGDRPPWKDKPSHYLDVEELGDLPYQDLDGIQMAPDGPLQPNRLVREQQQEQAARRNHHAVMAELRGRRHAPEEADAQQVRRRGAMLQQLQGLSPDLRRLSVNNAFETQSRSEAMRYAASQIDVDGHEAYAARRLGAMGTDRLQRLRALGPGFESLLVDPGLMSRSHFDGFHQFATERMQQSGGGTTTSDDAFRLRDEYANKLKREQGRPVYRGLKLKNAFGTQLHQEQQQREQSGQVDQRPGLSPIVTRTLQAHRSEVMSEARRDARSNPGIIRQLVSGQRTTLPELDEAFDKSVSDIILHRVNKGERSRGRLEQRMSREEFLATQPPWTEATGLPRTQYESRLYQSYQNRITTQNARTGRRLGNEAISQSVSYDPQVAAGFGGSKEFGGGGRLPDESVFNIHMDMSPVDVIAPEDYVSPDQMAAGVIVNNREIPNSAHLESLLLSPVQRDEISQVEQLQEADVPEFSVMDEVQPDVQLEPEAPKPKPKPRSKPRSKPKPPPTPAMLERAARREQQQAAMREHMRQMREQAKKGQQPPPKKDESGL